MAYATTERDFEIFKTEAQYWIKKLGMLDWEWFFEWLEVPDRAQVEYDIGDMMAQVVFSKNWEDLEPTPHQIRKCAFHEVQEVWLGTLSTIAIKRNFTADSLLNIVHRMIRTMENVYFEDDFSRRFKHGRK